MRAQPMDRSLGKSQAYPVVTDNLLAETARRILAVGKPLQILLFGSRARGDYEPDSDIDILIVEESEQGLRELASHYERALQDIYPDRTIIVMPLIEVERWQYVPGYLTTIAQRQGRIIYEDSDRLARLHETVHDLLVKEEDFKTSADLARDWLKRADVDLKDCRVLLDNDSCNNACFLAQQAAEKCLKAFLSLHAALPDKTHDLNVLASLCRSLGVNIDLSTQQLEILTTYAISSRYGLDFYPPAAEAENAFNLALKIRAFIVPHIPGESDTNSQTIDSSSPERRQK